MPDEHGRWRRGFWSLIGTQFENAFTDNALKYLVTFMILGWGFSDQRANFLVLLVTQVFAVPYLLFSMTGGWLADRFSKRTVSIGVKLFEIGIMVLVLAALALHNLPVALVAIFLMNTQGALFGPSKYGLLPELLPERRLSWGNGVLELGTFVAIVSGSQLGVVLAAKFHGREFVGGLLLSALSVVGLLLSLGIARVPAADPRKKYRANFLGDLFSQIRFIRQDRLLSMAVAGNTFFWFLGSALLFNLVFLGKVMKMTQIENGSLLAALSLGIGIGSMLAGYLSGGKIEYGFIPFGALGLTAFGFALGSGPMSYREVFVLLALLGFFGGFAAVPMNALMQHQPPEERKGGVLGAANLLSFVGILVGPVVCWLFQLAHFTPVHIFLVFAIFSAGATLYVITLLPDSLLRLLLWFFTHSVYRVRVEGRDNIPERGGALFVCNHMSFVDALLLIASTDRFIRFVVFKDIYEHPVVKPFARILKCIPISSQQRPREMIRSLREATEAIRGGQVVCIFAEGQITRIGQLLPFRRGMTRIMKNVDAPIVPIHLEGVWGSIFSFEKGRFLWKIPRRIPYPVTVTYGKPMPPTSTPFEVRQTVERLGTTAFAANKPSMRTLPRSFIRTARRHPLRFAMADGRVPGLRFGAALTRVVFLARRLRRVWSGQDMIGILLPPSVPGALVNLAALLLGKIPVNLNYTASNESLASCARQCNLRTVITSRTFLERLATVRASGGVSAGNAAPAQSASDGLAGKSGAGEAAHAPAALQLPVEAVMVEDLVQSPKLSEKLAALAVSWLLPAPTLQKAAGCERPAELDNVATIIFSSGSTGEPKGVMLTHYNIASNVRQVGQVFMLEGADRILGVLPFFHSMGFTATLALPTALGLGAVYHPNPLDARTIGELVQKHAVTMMVATPTFLQAYIRRCDPENFGSLDFVMAGAEKLPERVAQAFQDRFGVRPLEGYGATECSPVVAVNTKDFRAAGFRQVGAKRGTIGHPLPGISVEIRDPETHRPLLPGQPGLLFVRGPNVMLGYLNQPEKTAAVFSDGWYNTGDIAIIDEDGFITITDRLSRFSKIGGEMIPHIKIEEKLHELAGSTEQVFAVTAVADERKGERIVVLHTLPPEKLKPVVEQLASSDLPPLWRPRPNQFFRIDQLPYLGTGKLDLGKIRDTALRLSISGRTAEV